MARGEIRSLTGLRGLAAVFVMLYHFTRTVKAAGAPAAQGSAFLDHGYLSVDLFFVLSGFIMALTYHELFAGAGAGGRGAPRIRAAFATFLGHRIARVYPLYIVMTVIMAAIHYAPFMHTEVIPNMDTALLANIFLVQSWDVSRSFVGPAWSVSAELAAYLLFPWLLALFVSGSRRLAWAAGLVALAVCLTLATTTVFGTAFVDRSGPLDLWRATMEPVLRCVTEFSLGLLTYRFYRAASASRLAAFATISPLVLAAMVGACFWRDTDLIWLALLPPLILGLAGDRGVVARLLSSPPMHRLGVLSYAIYLVHPMLTKSNAVIGAALDARGIPFATPLTVGMDCVLVVLCAYPAYRLIERPGRRWLRGVFDGLERARRPARPPAGAKQTV